MTSYVPPGRVPEDDRPHDLSAKPGVQENFQWYGYDPISGFGIIAHYGTLPEDVSMWHVVVYLLLPGGTELATKQVGRPRRRGLAGTADHLLECVDPFRTWTLRYAGAATALRPGEMEAGLVAGGRSLPVDVELTFQSAGPVWDPAAGDGPAEGWSDLHHEQAMTMSGRITTLDTTVEVSSAFAYRDHSVGPRELRDIGRHSWNNGTFPDGRAFGCLRVGHLDGSTSDRGYVVADGAVHTLGVDAIPSMDGVDGEPSALTIVLASSDRSERITGQLVPDSRCSFGVAGAAEFALGTPLDEPDSYFLAQRLVRWEWDGVVGYGMSDRGGLIRLHSAGSPPSPVPTWPEPTDVCQ